MTRLFGLYAASFAPASRMKTLSVVGVFRKDLACSQRWLWFGFGFSLYGDGAVQQAARLDRLRRDHPPRPITDNGVFHISGALAVRPDEEGIGHIRGHRAIRRPRAGSSAGTGS